MPTQARTANVSFLIKNILLTEYKPLHFFSTLLYFFWLEDPRVLFQTLRVLPRFFNFFFFPTEQSTLACRDGTFRTNPAFQQSCSCLLRVHCFRRTMPIVSKNTSVRLFRLVSVQKDICEDTTNKQSFEKLEQQFDKRWSNYGVKIAEFSRVL